MDAGNATKISCNLSDQQWAGPHIFSSLEWYDYWEWTELLFFIDFSAVHGIKPCQLSKTIFWNNKYKKQYFKKWRKSYNYSANKCLSHDNKALDQIRHDEKKQKQCQSEVAGGGLKAM